MLGWRYAVGLVRNAKLWGGRPPTATPVEIDDLIFWITLGVIVGGRLGYVCFYMLVDPDQRAGLFHNPFIIFEIWTGGMSFHGAAIGVTLVMVAFSMAKRLSLLGVADIVAACEP